MTKSCSRCGLTKSLEDFPRHRSDPSGRGFWCKPCANAYGREWRSKNREQARQTCKRYYKENAEVLREKAARWRRDNPERQAKITRKAAASPAKRANDKAWRDANREKVRATKRMSEAKRRAGGDTRVHSTVITDLLRLQKHKCAICAKRLRHRQFHVDHIMPLSRGGPNVRANLQIACVSCNSRKWASDPIDFMRSLGRLI